MKRLIRLFCLIAAATALGSCARDKVIPDEELARIFRDAPMGLRPVIEGR